jgi:hypothetical protein
MSQRFILVLLIESALVAARTHVLRLRAIRLNSLHYAI